MSRSVLGMIMHWASFSHFPSWKISRNLPGKWSAVALRWRQTTRSHSFHDFQELWLVIKLYFTIGHHDWRWLTISIDHLEPSVLTKFSHSLAIIKPHYWPSRGPISSHTNGDFPAPAGLRGGRPHWLRQWFSRVNLDDQATNLWVEPICFFWIVGWTNP